MSQKIVLNVFLWRIATKLWFSSHILWPSWIFRFSPNTPGYVNNIRHIWVLEVLKVWNPLRKNFYSRRRIGAQNQLWLPDYSACQVKMEILLRPIYTNNTRMCIIFLMVPPLCPILTLLEVTEGNKTKVYMTKRRFWQYSMLHVEASWGRVSLHIRQK